MTRAPAYLAVVLLLALAGCGSDDTDSTAAPSSSPVATTALPTPTPTPMPAATTASPSPSPTRKPTLPTTMTDEGGFCTPTRCGHYVAGTSCKGIEWCKKAHLIEPGTWATEGGPGLSNCMWGLSKPPRFGLDDGGYATSYMQVVVPKGAIFDTNDCPSGWKWLGP